MRPDVKLGVVMSMVVVSVAGVYYLYRDKQETPIPLSGDPAAFADTSPSSAEDKPTEAVTKPIDQGARRRAETPAPSGSTRSSSPKSAEKRSVAGRPVSPAKKRATKPVVKRAPPSAGRPTASNKPRAQPRVKGARPRVPDSLKTLVPATSSAGDTRAGRRPVSTPIKPRGARAPAPGSRSARATPSAARTARPSAMPGSTVAVDFHRVLDGDTFSALSQQYYGSVGFTQFLIDSNPQVADANRLRVGDSIKIPARPSSKVARGRTAQEAPAAAPRASKRMYTVKPGDSFYKIAKERLGDAARWKELFELNQDRVGRDPSRLAIGQVLILPKS